MSFSYLVCLFCPRGFIIFFVSYMTAGRDSMCYDSILTHQFCWLKTQRRNNSNTLFIRSFTQESVRRLKNWLYSRINTTELYNITTTTLPWRWSGESKFESFICFCLLIAFHRHWCSQFWRDFARIVFQQHIRRFSYLSRNNTTGWLVIIIALAIILGLNPTLFFLTTTSEAPISCGRFIANTWRQQFFLFYTYVRNSNQIFQAWWLVKLQWEFFILLRTWIVVPSCKVFSKM